MWTKGALADDLNTIGVAHGDTVMVHAALRRIGKMLNGPDTFISALGDAVGQSGTLLAYTDWNAEYEAVLNGDGSVPAEFRDEILPFEPATSPANRDNGAFAEFLRQTQGAVRSRNPGPSCAAMGRQAEFLIADHDFDFGYGLQSPFARLCELGGKVLLAGAPCNTITLLHHAEHLADVPDKPLNIVEVPLLVDGATEWRWIKEFDTSIPIMSHLAEAYFGVIVGEALNAGIGCEGKIGHAESVLLPAADIRDFAVHWIEASAKAAGA